MKFNEKLFKLRKDNNLSQAEVAEMTGLSTTYICNLETGYTPNPSKKIIIKLAEFFTVTVDYLVIDAHQLTLSSKQRAFYRKFNRLNQDDSSLINSLINRFLEDYED